MNIRLLFAELIASAALLTAGRAHGGLIFVTHRGSGTVGEYTTSGSTINPTLISSLHGPDGIAVSNGHLFVTTLQGIGEYTTSGATINSSLITGLGPNVQSVAV